MFSPHLFETYISGSSLDVVEYPFEFVGRPCYDIICENQELDLLRIVPSLWTPDFLIAISRARLNRVHANPSPCLTPLVVSKASDNSFWTFTLHIVLAIVALTILVIFGKIWFAHCLVEFGSYYIVRNKNVSYADRKSMNRWYVVYIVPL